MRKSAGLLVYRKKNSSIEVFLVHPGGPYWKGKEQGAWSLPKGECEEGEEPLVTAKREFAEETGQPIDGHFIALDPIRQKGGKMVLAWAVEGTVDAENIVSNSFRMEYPYKSGQWISVPEVDKATWCAVEEARELMNAGQVPLLDDLLRKLEP